MNKAVVSFQKTTASVGAPTAAIAPRWSRRRPPRRGTGISSLLNLRLDVVVRDIAGLTGLSVIEAVCDGETNPKELASYRHGNRRKSAEEIAKALHDNGRQDYLFALRQELDLHKSLQAKIAECDAAT
jgi:hypothetical protein